MEATGTLTIETKVFGIGLSNDKFEALLNKVSDCPSIFGEITGGKSLVGGVEKWEVFPLLDYFGDLFPLLLGWVDTSWVVSTCV